MRPMERRSDRGLLHLLPTEVGESSRSGPLSESGPLTWSIASGAALLSAIHEAKLRPGIDPLPVFEEVEQALFSEVQGVRLDLEAEISNAVRNTGCGKPKNRGRNYRKER